MITGKTVVVTGGSRGIGRGLVERLLQRNNTVIATTRKPGDAKQLQELASSNPLLCVTELDTSIPESIEEWAAALKHHTNHVDVLVNNAGVYGRRLGFQELQPADFHFAFNTNALGPFLVCQQLHKQGLLGPAGGSLVVNITSIMASHGDPTISSAAGGAYAYRASKAALNIMSKALALDLGSDGVQVVLLHPGYVRTDMTGGAGWVDVAESADGMLRVLEDGRPLHGRWYSFDGSEVPW